MDPVQASPVDRIEAADASAAPDRPPISPWVALVGRPRRAAATTNAIVARHPDAYTEATSSFGTETRPAIVRATAVPPRSAPSVWRMNE